MIQRTSETDFEADVLAADCVVLANFWVGWSDECRRMRLLMEALDRLIGQFVRIVAIDCEKNQALTTEFGVHGVPTLLIFENGRVVNRFSGMVTAEEIRPELAQSVAEKLDHQSGPSS